MILSKNLVSCCLLTVLSLNGSAWAKQLKVITTTADLASIVHEIGLDQVKVESLASPLQDPHFVDAKPSLIVKLMNADLFIETGLELEIGWAPLLIRSCGNPRIQANAPGHLDASRAIVPIEVPQNPSRAMGDVHPGGNPHYLIDPENGKLVAKLICQKLKELAPKDADYFQNNLSAFESRIDEKMKQWTEKMAPYKGSKFVSYHRDVSYLAHRFGLISVGEIEPKPGIPPTAKHTAELMDRIRSEKVRMILTEPWHEPRTPQSMGKTTGTKVLVLTLFPNAVPQAKDYLSAVDYNVNLIVQTLSNRPPDQ